MKLYWSALLSSLVVLSSRILGSVSALETSAIRGRGRGLDETNDIVTDIHGLKYAIENASNDPTNPTTIPIAPDATIDFDDPTAGIGRTVLDIGRKYFSAECIGYSETNKCLFERSANGGRFFDNNNIHFALSFTGIKFKGGDAEQYSAVRDGGVIDLICPSPDCEAHFTDCDFVDNVAQNGGAIYIQSTRSSPTFLSCTRCMFELNEATYSGGSVYAKSSDTLNINISETTFANGDGNDITGVTWSDGEINFKCTETVAEDIVMPDSQTCSLTASPTSSPSPTASPTGSPSQSPTAPWEIITSDDFASDLGSFTTIGGSGGTNDATVFGGAVCLSGKGVESSIFHSAQHDVASYSSLYVEVTFVFEGAQNTERLIVEYSADGGANWTVMKRFNFGSFQNGVTYNKLVDFASLSDQAMIRIRSRIIGDGKVCIDEIKFEGLPGN